MSGGAPRSPRDEAERLVAAALAAASVAARNAGGVATGSAECCVCPVCRVIAAMREPDPDVAERLASLAGDLAGGVAGLLRAFGARNDHSDEPGDQGEPPAQHEPPAKDESPALDEPSGRDGPPALDEPSGRDGPAEPAGDPWRAATRGSG